MDTGAHLTDQPSTSSVFRSLSPATVSLMLQLILLLFSWISHDPSLILRSLSTVSLMLQLILALFSWISYDPRDTEHALQAVLKWIDHGTTTLLKLLQLLELYMPQHMRNMYKTIFDLTRLGKDFITMVSRMIEIVSECWQERITWGRRGLILWLHYPPPNDNQPYFGNIRDIIELVCSIIEFIETTITCVEQEKNLIMLPILFGIITTMVLCYKFYVQSIMHRRP